MRSVKWLFLFAGIVIVCASLRKPTPQATRIGTFDRPTSQIHPPDGSVQPLPEASASSPVNWLTLQQAEDSVRTNGKPILIDLYTEWCGWCKVMDKKTYANKKVAEYLQRKFYSVKLDAETRRDIVWKGKKFSFNPNYRANDFSVYLTNGNLSYPTTVIIPAGNGEPQAIPGYLEPKDFELIVKFFGEEKFGNVSFEDYRKKFKATW
jgi:thioredoxin-related protein